MRRVGHNLKTVTRFRLTVDLSLNAKITTALYDIARLDARMCMSCYHRAGLNFCLSDDGHVAFHGALRLLKNDALEPRTGESCRRARLGVRVGGDKTSDGAESARGEQTACKHSTSP